MAMKIQKAKLCQVFCNVSIAHSNLYINGNENSYSFTTIPFHAPFGAQIRNNSVTMTNLTCAFCKGETRQQTTEVQFKLKLSSITRKVGSNAYIRHFPSITSANFGPETVRRLCCASSRHFFSSFLTSSLMKRAISTWSP